MNSNLAEKVGFSLRKSEEIANEKLSVIASFYYNLDSKTFSSIVMELNGQKHLQKSKINKNIQLVKKGLDQVVD
ncbi:hypothetical protein [Paenibacillus prosopidis]|uniref:Uncharacterized protein n=1 Tax=Paenibacillus prosopidis TaxID=630520 RepID=A0A368VN27_9BACL|nr:hypothetical protein [Paenibacillus prosopidis]RCW41103.1 hypothetical protein DFP97_1277 [Paenibacillus prosopidis]